MINSEQNLILFPFHVFVFKNSWCQMFRCLLNENGQRITTTCSIRGAEQLVPKHFTLKYRNSCDERCNHDQQGTKPGKLHFVGFKMVKNYWVLLELWASSVVLVIGLDDSLNFLNHPSFAVIYLVSFARQVILLAKCWDNEPPRSGYGCTPSPALTPSPPSAWS